MDESSLRTFMLNMAFKLLHRWALVYFYFKFVPLRRGSPEVRIHDIHVKLSWYAEL